MRSLLLALLLPTLALAQTVSSSSVRITSADGSKAALVATPATAGGDGATSGNGLAVVAGQYLSAAPILTTGKLSMLQLDASGNLKVTGSFSSASVGATGAAVPASADYAGFSDGTNLQGARVFDADTGGGTQHVVGASLRISGAGGSTEAKGQGTMALSIPVAIASDQTAIPATQSGNWSTRLLDGAGTSVVVGQAAMAASLPVVIASNQSSIPVASTPVAQTTFSAGQQAVTATAVALGTNTAKNVCVRHVMGGSQEVIYVGPTGVLTSNGFPLYAGDTQCFPLSNTNLVFVVAAGTGSSVAYDWSN